MVLVVEEVVVVLQQYHHFQQVAEPHVPPEVEHQAQVEVERQEQMEHTYSDQYFLPFLYNNVILIIFVIISSILIHPNNIKFLTKPL